MKIGINRWTLPSHLSLSECFTQCREAGFECVEINLAEDGELHLGIGEADAKAIRSAADRAGVALLSVSTGLGWRFPLTSPDPAVRQQAKENIRQQLQAAQWLGANAILVVPGTVNAEVAYDDAYQRALEGLKELAKDAERLGVDIGVENVWNKFLLSPLEFARFLDEIGCARVGAYFDVGNVLVYGYPEQWIRILGSRIKKVHVKDFKTQIGNMSGFCNLLQGDVNWMRVKEELHKIGYDEVITAEVEGYKTRPELGLKHIADAMRALYPS